MSVSVEDPIKEIAGQVADCLSQHGYAFVEDDKIDALAAALQAFLLAAGVRTHHDEKSAASVVTEAEADVASTVRP